MDDFGEEEKNGIKSDLRKIKVLLNTRWI